jgi:mono/diheme cytochrome c family protein
MSKRKSILLAIFAASVLLVSFQNCSKPSPLKFADYNLINPTSLQNAALNILNTNCSSCHSSTNMAGGIGDLTNIQYLVWSRLVVPGDADLSPLMTSAKEGRMPIDYSLSDYDVAALRKWVMQLTTTPTAPPATSTVQPNFASLQAQVFGPRCSVCHTNRNYKYTSYQQAMASVVPGNADASPLYMSIVTGMTGGKMPQYELLSGVEIKAIKDWINAGAANN